MPSTYTVNLGIEKPATGEQSGTWGDTTNVNFDIIDQAINGVLSLTLASAGTSGSPNVLSIDNGATSDGRNKWIEFVDGGDLGANAYVQLDPNDAEKIVFFRNSLSGSRSVFVFQGTYNAANDFEIPAGYDVVLKFNGGGASATVTDVFKKLRVTELYTPTLGAGTADINDGTVEAVIGGTTPKAGTFTTLTANTNLTVNASTTVDGIIDDDTMATASATKLSTSESIKAYVDSQVGTVDTWAEVLANGATSGATSPEIISGQALKTNTINETTAGSGVTIDSVLLKDDSVNAATLEVTTLKANDGTAAGSIANSTGVVTLNSVDINGGNIDGTTIGATSTANGNFSTVNASDVETSVISAKDGTTAINIANTTGAVDIDTSLNVDGTITGDGLTIAGDSILDSEANFSPATTTTADKSLIVASSGATAGAGQLGASIAFSRINTQSPRAAIAAFDATANYEQMGLKFYTHGSSTGTDPMNLRFQIDHDGNTRVIDDSLNTHILLGASGAATFNEQGNNSDFRVESVNNDYMLFVDASTDYVAIGHSGPSATLDVKSTTAVMTTLRGTAAGISYLDLTNYATSANGVGAGVEFRANSDTQERQVGYINSVWTDNTDATRDSQMQFYNNVNGSSNVALKLGAAETVFNEQGEDVDFRVESDNITSMLLVDAGTDELYVGGVVDLGASVMTVKAGAGELNTLSVGSSTNNSASIGNFTSGDVVANLITSSSKFGGIVQGGTNGSLVLGIRDNDSTDGLFVISGNSDQQTNDYSRLRLSVTPNTFVVNETGDDADFRVESLNNGNMIFVDGGNDRVGIGQVPTTTFEVNGDTIINTGSGENFQVYRSVNAYLKVENGTSNTAISTPNLFAIKPDGTSVQKYTFEAGNLTLNGPSLEFIDNSLLNAGTASTTATTQVSIYSFSATTYTGAKLLVCVTDSTATERYITEVLVTHDGTTAVSTEYGQVATDTALATFDVDISGGNVRLLATPASSNSMTFKVMSTQLLA